MHPVLFAMQAVLSLYQANVGEAHPVDALRSLFVCIGFAALLQVAALILLRDATRAALVASLAIVAFFSFGRASQVLSGLDLPIEPRLAVGAVQGAVVVTLSVWIARWRRHPVVLGNGVGLVALALTALPVGQLGVHWARTLASDNGRPDPPSLQTTIPGLSSVPARAPDIYYIVLDGYARSDAMQELYGFDNGEFIDWLRQQGFHVSMRSRANYAKTLHALVSTLNMEYVHDLTDVEWSRVDSTPLINLLRRNRVAHLLRAIGYKVVTFTSGYDLTEFSKVDHRLEPAAAWSEFANVLLATTPVPWLLGEGRDLHARHRQRLQYVFDKIPEIHEGDRPRFVFAHVLAPHPPFVFDHDGNPTTISRPFGFHDGSDYMKNGGTVDEYVVGYGAQARWVTEQLQSALGRLLRRYEDAPPIIIVHSDHGPGSRLDWTSLPDTDLNERFGILMACYLPGGPTIDLGDEFSPVNIFRLVFDLYFGADMGPLEHRSFFNFLAEPFRFIDVSDPRKPFEIQHR